MLQDYPLVRKIYLYLFSLVGLVLMVIAGVQLINLGLKAFIFTQAEKQEALYQTMPSCGSMAPETVETIVSGNTLNVQLTESERAGMASWLESYKAWQKQQESYDPITANRQQTAAIALAMLIVGFPLYFYHWRLARKESVVS